MNPDLRRGPPGPVLSPSVSPALPLFALHTVETAVLDDRIIIRLWVQPHGGTHVSGLWRPFTGIHVQTKGAASFQYQHPPSFQKVPLTIPNVLMLSHM